MKRADTAPKLLLLIPMLALGIVEVATKAEVATSVSKQLAPDRGPDRCFNCEMPA